MGSTSNTDATFESDHALGQYLLFHYGSPEQVAPFETLPGSSMEFHSRVVQLLDETILFPGCVALDLGCAVGRVCFELSKRCGSVLGLDRSLRFIEAAQQLQKNLCHEYALNGEGDLMLQGWVPLPPGSKADKVEFRWGEIASLSPDVGRFDVVTAISLLERLESPRSLLDKIHGLVRPGGQLLIASSYDWDEAWTPRKEWLTRGLDGKTRPTLEAIGEILKQHFRLSLRQDQAFFLRETARTYRCGVCEVTRWTRLND